VFGIQVFVHQKSPFAGPSHSWLGSGIIQLFDHFVSLLNNFILFGLSF
jgi:hypothetical protein